MAGNEEENDIEMGEIEDDDDDSGSENVIDISLNDTNNDDDELIPIQVDNTEISSKVDTKKIAKAWTDLSEVWNDEESGRKKGPNARFVPQAAQLDRRRFVNYADDKLENKKTDVAARLDFKSRKAPWEMKGAKTLMVEKDEEGEVFSTSNDEGEEEDEEEEDEDSAWSRRLAGPRMKMYADEEEDNRKRDIEIKNRYGPLIPNETENSEIGNEIPALSTGHIRRGRGFSDSDRRGSFGTDDEHNERFIRHDEEDEYRGRTRRSSNGFQTNRLGKKKSDKDHRNPYTTSLNRVSHRTISKHSPSKSAIMDRLGSKASIKSRLGPRFS